MVIVLDDLSVSDSAAPNVRGIAQAIVAHAALNDRVMVQSLSHPDTTAFSDDRLRAWARIDHDSGGDGSFRPFEGIGA